MKSYHIQCPKCNNDHSFYRYGKDPDGYQKYLCRTCQHQFAPERPRAREEHTPKSIIFKNMTTLRNIAHGRMNFFTLVSSPNYFCKPSLFFDFILVYWTFNSLWINRKSPSFSLINVFLTLSIQILPINLHVKFHHTTFNLIFVLLTMQTARKFYYKFPLVYYLLHI